MTTFRTSDDRFAELPEFPFEPHYIDVGDGAGGSLRMHYLDEGAPDAPVALLVHGMPSWSYLYRRMIPALVAAGFRCIAPDHIGFGRSDKVLEDEWYSIGRHASVLGELIRKLDLRSVTLVCQDWGGPIGLHQAVAMQERFERLVILNTWLHHATFTYTPAIRRWQSLWQPGGPMATVQGCGVVLLNFVQNFPRGTAEPLTTEQAFAAYEAPFPDQASKAGPRRFPLSIPIDGQNPDNAAAQEADFEALSAWAKPIHFIWGTKDLVFEESWGRRWAATFPQATFDPVEAGHFLQETHGAEIAEILVGRLAGE